MKFHELGIGQKFEFQGAAYVKTTPMIASAIENSTQKFMARSAPVKPLEVSASPAGPIQAMLHTEIVHTAFETFYARCQAALEEIQNEISPESFHAVQDKLIQERQVFLNSLLGKTRPDHAPRF